MAGVGGAEDGESGVRRSTQDGATPRRGSRPPLFGFLSRVPFPFCIVCDVYNICFSRAHGPRAAPGAGGAERARETVPRAPDAPRARRPRGAPRCPARAALGRCPAAPPAPRAPQAGTRRCYTDGGAGSPIFTKQAFHTRRRRGAIRSMRSHSHILRAHILHLHGGAQFTWTAWGEGAPREAHPAMLTGPPGRRGGRRPPARRAASRSA